MRTLLLLSLVLTFPAAALAQTTTAKPPPAQPAPAKPQPTAPATPGAQTPTKPAQPRPQTPRRAQPAARSGMAITVTDPQGATIPDVRVEVMGPTERNGNTNDSGQLSFPGLQSGTYRLRFSGESVISFEREVALRAGQIADLDIMLNRAPEEKPDPPPAAVPSAPALGPAGQPQTLSVVDVLEKEFVGRQARRESLLSCTGNTRTTMIQLNEPLPERLYSDADAVYYVLGGEGLIRVNGRDTPLATNGFASVPRGTGHSFERRGNRALVLLAVLSGAPCEEAR